MGRMGDIEGGIQEAALVRKVDPALAQDMRPLQVPGGLGQRRPLPNPQGDID